MVERVTIQNIAERVGVSHATVSRVLNGRMKEGWAGTAQRAENIRKVAQEMGYRKNMAAVAVQRGSLGRVGIVQVTDRGKNHLPKGRVEGVLNGLRESGMKLDLAEVELSRLGDPEYVPDILRELSVDGVLIDVIVDFPEQMEPLFRKYHLPAVWMNSKHRADSVCFDDYHLGQEVGLRLLALGHRRLAWWDQRGLVHADAERRHYSVGGRLAGLSEVVKDAGLELDVRSMPRVPAAACEGVYIEMLRQIAPRPTAIYCYAYEEAVALKMAALKMGLSVPGDLSIVSSTEELTFPACMQLDVMFLDNCDLGKAASRQVVQKIASPGVEFPQVSIKPVYHVLGSTGPPAA